MGGSPDPLGKRALYRRGMDGSPAWSDARPDHARPAGKHALFTAPTPCGEEEPVVPVLSPPQHGLLAITCSSCGSVSRVGPVDFLRLQFPFGGWLPRRTFDRWMTCPACRRRAWTSVTWAR